MDGGDSTDLRTTQVGTRSSELLDLVSKGTIIVLFVTYTFGFLVIAIHNASYGFAQVNPFKSKVLAAGALFMLLTVLPYVSAREIFSHKQTLAKAQRSARWIVAASSYYLACISLSFAIMGFYASTPPKPSPIKARWFGLSETVLFVALYIGLTIFLTYAWHSYESRPRKILWIGVGLLAPLLLNTVYHAQTSTFALSAAWFFGVGILGVVLEYFLTDLEGKRRRNWSSLVVWAAGAVALFPTTVYREIKYSWGGGSPIDVVVYLSRDSRVLPGQQLEGELLDESDSGIYVAQRGQSKAIFIPRVAVAAMYFSDSPLAPEYLKEAQPAMIPEKPGLPTQGAKKP
jgi:hypothetical protein